MSSFKSEDDDIDDSESPPNTPPGDENPDDVRQDITAAVTRHWRENVPEKKALIREFRAAVGIGMMLELQPEDFPKAYQLLRKLEAWEVLLHE